MSSGSRTRVKVDGNAWERRYQARHFCNLAFPSSKSAFFPRERTFAGRKFSSELVNLNLVEITARLEIQEAAAKLKGPTDFYRGPGIFTVPSYTLTPGHGGTAGR